MSSRKAGLQIVLVPATFSSCPGASARFVAAQILCRIEIGLSLSFILDSNIHIRIRRPTTFANILSTFLDVHVCLSVDSSPSRTDFLHRNPVVSDGQSIVITTRGAGQVLLLFYFSNNGISSRYGTTTTNREGTSRFIISRSNTFERFAFFWEGEHQAFCTIGEDTNRVPVGTSWKAASCVTWGSTSVTTQNVSLARYIARPFNGDNHVTYLIAPDDLPSPEIQQPTKPLTKPITKSITKPITKPLAQTLCTGTYSITNASQLKAISLNDSFEGTPIIGEATNFTVTDNSKVRFDLSLPLSLLITKHGSSGMSSN